MMPDEKTPLILIIDDERLNTVILSTVLKNEGYRVVSVNKGIQGCEEFKKHCPDIVLLDIIMKDIDGFQVCEEIRSLPEGKHVPILMLTGLEDDDSIKKAFDSGADEYIFKPINFTVLRHRVRRLIEAERVRKMALYYAFTDPLTGVLNRRAFFERLGAEMDRSVRGNTNLSLILCDIDYFKKINDTYGHLVGDKVLKTIADILSTGLRSYDFVGRYGGEEFFICLPGANLEQAVHIANRIRQFVIDEQVMLEEQNVALRFTASFGVSQFKCTDQVDIDKLISDADKALYKAKESGRNKVVVYHEEI